jgi:hypothetical protein
MGLRALVVVMLLAGTAVAEELPFEVENARKGIAGWAQAAPDGSAAWVYSAQVVVAGDGGDKETRGLAVRMSALEADKGWRARAVATLGKLPEKLAPGGALELTLSAKLPHVGDYHGELVLYQGAVQRVVPVTVKVEAGSEAAPLEELGKAIVTLEGDAPSAVELRLRNTGAQVLTLGSPRLVSARRVDKIKDPAAETQLPGAEIDSVPDPVGALDGGAVARFGVSIRGLDDPGVYQLEVQVPVSGSAPKTSAITVYRRARWWCAAGWIALGAVVAFGVRKFTQGGKDRLKARRALAELRPKLVGIRDEASAPAYAAAAIVLIAEADQRLRDARWGADATTLLKATERLTARVYLLGEIADAARTVARLDAAAQVEPRKTLDAALAVARVDPGADKAADIDAQRQKVAGLDVNAVLAAQLTTAIAELATALDRLAESTDPTVVARVRELRTSLAQAQTALAAGRLLDGAAAVDALRPAFLALAVKDLRGRIEVVPFEADADAWPAVKSAVATQLDRADAPGEWAARRDAFLAAQRAYFKAALEALAAYAKQRAADTADVPTDAARLTQIAAELTAELAAGDAGIDRAARIYAARVAEVKGAARTRGGGRGIGALESDDPGASWLAVPGELLRGGAASVPPVRLLDARITYTDWLVTAVVLLVAIASGVKQLWLTNLAWGVEGDALTAFLWGAGVGAVGDAFTGLVGLRDKLGG